MLLTEPTRRCPARSVNATFDPTPTPDARAAARGGGGIEKKKRVVFAGERERHQHRLSKMERAMWDAKKRDAERERKSPHHPNKPRSPKPADHTLDNFRHMQKHAAPAKGASLVGVAYQVFRMY